ncbi:MAG: triose-phosphate isomerase [Proteobacteria bacterium]|nr:MAG: triose-phosphate isomerase [Pseudomonadota bacterium]
MRKFMIAGNWKLHGSHAMIRQWLADFMALDTSIDALDVALCVPYVYLPMLSTNASKNILIGAQDVSAHDTGAHTGEVSAAMLQEVGARLVLIGHSERRQDHAESDELVRAKFKQALAQGLMPVVCVGESQQQRENNETFAVIERQLNAIIDLLNAANADQCILAYEPIWAIGTGLTASAEQAQEVHQFIRSQLAHKDVTMARQIRLLYGGSCKGSNAYELFSMPDVDGGLIGGASLKAEDFMAICHQANKLLDKTQSD